MDFAVLVGLSLGAKVAFAQPPSSAVAGIAIAPAVTVQIQDASGHPLAQPGVTVTLSLTSGSGTLSGTTSQATDFSGLATFPGLSVNLAGAKQLTAASTGLTPAISGTFDVTAGRAATLAVSGGSGQDAGVSTPFAQPLQLTLTDSLGNPGERSSGMFLWQPSATRRCGGG